MGEKRTGLVSYSDTEIAQMFSDYVARMQDKPRHTKAAIKEADAFDTFCGSEFPRNVRLQNGLFERMMNAAVEYEESGFIAGFKTAMALLSGNDGLLPVPSGCRENAGKDQEQALPPSTYISITEPETRQHEATNDSKEGDKADNTPVGFRKNPPDDANFKEDSDHINTVQIAEMFGTTNFKVVRRIEKLILPYLDERTKAHFIRVEGFNIQHKKCTFYKMDSTACQLYLKELEAKKGTYVNIAGGYAKLKELMERMFPAEKLALPA